MTAVRGLQAAKRATVSITSGDVPKGHGLLLEFNGANYVLTCHHVVAGIEPSALRVVAQGPRGEEIVAKARVVKRLSRPERDAVVLKVRRLAGPDHPWLHSLGPGYSGGLQTTVALSPRPGELESFDASLGPPFAATFTVPGRGSVERYVLRGAHPLGQAENATEGISGGVVVCEEGVVGLVHFARAETSVVGRAAIMNPLAAWAEGWPALAKRIQPFADKVLARLARVVRADSDELAEVLPIPHFNADVYVARRLEADARVVLTESKSLLLLGRPKSGKTRVVRELLRARSDAAVVIPKRKSPPLHFEPSGLAARDVIVVVDNLDEDREFLDPADWWYSIRDFNEGRTTFIGTCRSEDWEGVSRIHSRLADELQASTVYASAPPPGHNLTDAEGWELAKKLGLSEAQFRERFDGTPGSLLDGPVTPAATTVVARGGKTGVSLESLAGEDEAPSNVPAFTSQFVGREGDIAALKKRLRETRFVTIVGPSGSGKTRLAFHAAAQLRGRYPGGVWVADLSPYRTAAHVPSVVAQAVRVGDAAAPSRTERLVALLSDKRLLLVLNGCDHVREAAAHLAQQLVQGCPELACLATCRTPLAAAGENVYELAPFDVAEPAASDAVELFIERAREVGRSMPFSKRDLATVAAITRRVAGNALAIELIAGEAGTATLGGVAARLRERLARAEESGPEGADPAVAAAVDLVSETMGERERLLFEVVCVFVGGFTLDGAEALGATAGVAREDVPKLLRRLTNRRLILVDRREGMADRFRMLEALRQDGRRRLAVAGRIAEMERRHAEYFVGLAEQAMQARGARDEAAWLDHLELELGNLRAVLFWALPSREKDEDGIEIRIKLGAHLWWFWYQRSHLTEGRRWLRRLCTALGESSQPKAESEERRRLRAELLNGAGTFEYLVGDLDAAEAFHREALALRETLNTERWVAGSLNNLGLVARRRGMKDRAAHNFRKALEISRAHGNAFWEAMHLTNLGMLLRDWGEPSDARAAQEESLTIAARVGGSWGLAQALAALGNLEADDGKLNRARELLQRSLTIRTDIQNPQGVAESLAGLARVERLAKRFDDSVERYRDALDHVERLGDRAAIAETLEGLGLALVERDAAAAARAFGTAQQVRVTIGFPLSPRARDDLAPGLDRARGRLGEERFAREHRAGLEARLSGAIAELEVIGVG